MEQWELIPSIPDTVGNQSKNEAEKVAEAMTVKRLLGYYKEKYEFVTTGEAELPNDD